MKKKTKYILIGLLCLALTGGVLATILLAPREEAQTEAPATQPVTTVPATTPATQPAPKPTEPEAKEEEFLLTFVGDCTLGSMPSWFGRKSSFVRTIGTDYDYPFANVRQYFEKDDLTMINLESVLADSGKGADKRFVFRGPSDYIQMLTGASVEAVTLANNHTMDFGKQGYNNTLRILNDAGIAYVEESNTKLIATESGLIIGFYADYEEITEDEILLHINDLKKAGAELIVCAFHWGVEGSYRANNDQKRIANTALEAGAHIVCGHHPHVLQKIEKRENGVIYYSLGNFSFGGNDRPRDKDSAIIQQKIIRQADGEILLGETNIIPVAISSAKSWNNYQPTPCEKESEQYQRILSKLDGSFTGRNLTVFYAKKEKLGKTPTVAMPFSETVS